MAQRFSIFWITPLWMTKYIIGEIFSSGGVTLCKNHSDQTVDSLHLKLDLNLKISQTMHSKEKLKYFLVDRRQKGIITIALDNPLFKTSSNFYTDICFCILYQYVFPIRLFFRIHDCWQSPIQQKGKEVFLVQDSALQCLHTT